MITVMKASAGSGKTFALAEKYIRMLLASDDLTAYRHILAVTFTNKATDEMKERIITELFKVANPQIERTQMNLPDDPQKAGKILSNILHDYGAFAVSTIDKFFQQTLRSFARELGQFNRYEVELDKKSLVEEAVDTILDELDSNNPDDRRLIDFLVENLEDSLAEGKGLDIEGALKKMATELKSARFTDKAAALTLDPSEVYSEQQLSSMKACCRKLVKDFEQEVTDKAAAVKAAMMSCGLKEEDFAGGSKSWMKAVCAMDWVNGTRKAPTSAVYAKLVNPSAQTWFSKKEQWRFDSAWAAMGEATEAFAGLWDKSYSVYNTARIMLSQVYGLGIASRLFEMFGLISAQKNVVCLDDSNLLLKKIIDGSDAPFIYEKTGTRFGTFMLDEFQDTSTTQWENFKPLLHESEGWKEQTIPADGKVDDTYNNLIVGDVKQSIYRWRDSDWNLLDNGVDAEFGAKVVHDPLIKNWRSLKNIVDFNNALYPEIARMLDEQTPAPDGCSSVKEIYAGKQFLALGQEQQGGTVDVCFKQDEDEQLEQILHSIEHLHYIENVPYGDIAVLVRKKIPGTKVAQMLIEHKIPVVTDASLRMKNSVSVRRLVSMMSYVDNPENQVGSYVAVKYGLSEGTLSYHSLPDLAETLYRTLCQNPECQKDCQKEVMYVASFMDYVMNYARTKGNNLHAFLSYWVDQDPEVNSAASSNAVKISTIHKSKGLAFKYTIVPFVENIILYDSKRTTTWAVPHAQGTELAAFADRLYHIPLSAQTQDTLFSAEYLTEKFSQGVDAINLLYVATTRAKKGLQIIACGKNKNPSIADMMSSYFGEKDFHIGEDVFGVFDSQEQRQLLTTKVETGMEGDDATKARSESSGDEYTLKYPYYNIGERLQVRPYASDFFTDTDNTYAGLSFLDKGIVLHDILSRVGHVCDLEASVDQEIASGTLAASSRQKVLDFLTGRIASRPEFFPEEDGVKVMMESTLIGMDGKECRPDRVLLLPSGKVLVVDYKFASHKSEYEEQIDRYRKVFMDMGYADVEACLWYVYSNKIFPRK